MGYFEACEACGLTDSLVVRGLCASCQEAEDRAAAGSKPMQRESIWVGGDGQVTLMEPFKVSTIMAGGPHGRTD